MDHRTGKPLDKIPDYVTNKKKKKTVEHSGNVGSKKEDTPAGSSLPADPNDAINVIQIPDEDLVLPSTSGLIRGFQFNEDQNYDMSILLDIDEFSDFQLLSPDKEYDGQDDGNDDVNEQFAIIDATGKLLLSSVISFSLKFTSRRSSVLQRQHNQSKHYSFSIEWSVDVK